MAKRYATQPIARALQLHQENGAIVEFSHPKSDGGTTRWLVTISGYGTEELTSAQAWGAVSRARSRKARVFGA